MAKLSVKPGSTDQIVLVFIQDSSSAAGAGLTGLAYDTANLVCYYARPGAAAAQLALATQTVTGAHSDGGFVEVDATNMPGVYRLDLSDAVVAAGVRSTVVMLKGAANMVPCPLEIDLDAEVDASASAVASVTAGVTIANDAIKAVTFDETTAWPLTAPDTGATAVARTGADSDTLETLSDQIDGLSVGGGDGARTVSCVVEDDSTNLLEGVVVRLTKGMTVLRQVTDASGECTFNCDDGDWVVAASLAGYSYGGSTLTVNGDESLPIEMTPVVIPAASDPALCNCYLYTYDALGVLEADVSITFQLLTPPGGDGKAYDGDTFDEASDGDGLLQIEIMRGATYRARRETDGSWVEFTVPFEDAWPLPRMLGG